MNIAIFASGSGSNAENITEYFDSQTEDRVTLILTDNPNAGVLARARTLQVPTFVFSKTQLNNGTLVDVLQKQEIDFIVLAGFLKLIPEDLLAAFPNRIVNIHPALLPKYGGKGMYGSHVHNAVKAAGEKETGITIHFVNARYDEGNVILQKAIEISAKDKVKDIEKKVHKLEYDYYPEVIENVLDQIRESEKNK